MSSTKELDERIINELTSTDPPYFMVGVMLNHIVVFILARDAFTITAKILETYVFVLPLSAFGSGRLELSGAERLIDKWPNFGQHIVAYQVEALENRDVPDLFRCFTTHAAVDSLYCAAYSKGNWIVFDLTNRDYANTFTGDASQCCTEKPVFLSAGNGTVNSFFMSTDGLFSEFTESEHQLTATGTKFRFCPSEPSIRPDGSQCTEGSASGAPPPLMTGFVANGNVYLVGKGDKVWISSTTGFDQNGAQPIALSTVPMKDFFVQGNNQNTFLGYSRSTVIGATIILLGLFLLVFGIFKFSKKKKLIKKLIKKKIGKKRKTNYKKNTLSKTTSGFKTRKQSTSGFKTRIGVQVKGKRRNRRKTEHIPRHRTRHERQTQKDVK